MRACEIVLLVEVCEVRGRESRDIVRFEGVRRGIIGRGRDAGGSSEGASDYLLYLPGMEVDAGPESGHCWGGIVG